MLLLGRDSGLPIRDLHRAGGHSAGCPKNGTLLNPTMSTFWRYAEAIGARIKLGVEAEPAEAG